ncbi:Putative amino-acid ABC transporter-binding protein YhdW [Seminavis robusta]|uniref:Amino-acid ABC transporter-binding protein YhdW n=1 Tax=Seminavis robusta TaxID=568900 RepID=A0A9N8E239_9STRA|nr:Putative amino-acid ABC transporter-binding protein YhdW [Seminavis robusta]|eukprot:Sro572_g168780.1 Putative amino-acid ABC transporter-binding protein YhdW (866) ;mRNA; r:25010-27799
MNNHLLETELGSHGSRPDDETVEAKVVSADQTGEAQGSSTSTGLTTGDGEFVAAERMHVLEQLRMFRQSESSVESGVAFSGGNGRISEDTRSGSGSDNEDSVVQEKLRAAGIITQAADVVSRAPQVTSVTEKPLDSLIEERKLSGEADLESSGTSATFVDAQEMEDHQQKVACGISAAEFEARANVGAIAVCVDAGGDSASTASSDRHRPADHISFDAELGSSRMDNSNEDTCVTAVTVDEDMAELEQGIRDRIIQEAVEASAVLEPDNDSVSTVGTLQSFKNRPVFVGAMVTCLLFAVAAVAAIAVLGHEQGQAQESSAPSTIGNATLTGDVDVIKKSTLQKVRDRGFVRCGVYENAPGFSAPNLETGELEGMNIDHCRAISLAVFGTPDLIEPVIVSFINRFSFSQATLWMSGLAFGGAPERVRCMDEIAAASTASGELPPGCEDVKVCVSLGTTTEAVVRELLPETVPIFGTLTQQDAISKFVLGVCNVFAAEPVSMSKYNLHKHGYSGSFMVGDKKYSREPLALITSQDDPQWSALVNAVVNIFYLAEAENVSKDNAATAFQELFDSADSGITDEFDLVSMAVSIVSEFGNYADLYEEHLEVSVPRSGLNLLYRPDTGALNSPAGLLYAMPFGNLDALGPGPVTDERLDKILSRGYLRCGVRAREGFATFQNGVWSGFDVDICRAISAAIFNDIADDAVTFEDITGTGSDYYCIVNDDVDVVIGTPASIQTSLMESKTGNSYAFSPAYFYDVSDRRPLVAATAGNEPQWSDFVSSVVSAIIYAEEAGISQESYLEMPLVKVFGADLQHMLQSAIQAVGSYAEIYERHLEVIIPRSGANRLNSDIMGGPQHYPLPLFCPGPP